MKPRSEDPQEAPRRIPCERCNATGVLPYWQIVSGQVQERQGRCGCVNGLLYPSLPHIDHIDGVPKGLNAAQMSAVLNAMVAHPGLPPGEAIGFIPRSRADLAKAFSKLGAKVEREFSKRYCPDEALMASWVQIRDAILAEYHDEPDELPF